MEVFGYAYPLSETEVITARTALETAGAHQIFIEEPWRYSPGVSSPPAYTACLSQVSAGDRLIVYRMSDVLPLVLFGVPEAARILVEEVGIELQVFRGDAELTAPLPQENVTSAIPGGVELFEFFGPAPEAARERLSHIPGPVGLAARLPLPSLVATLDAERRSRVMAKTNGVRCKIDLRGMPPPKPLHAC